MLAHTRSLGFQPWHLNTSLNGHWGLTIKHWNRGRKRILTGESLLSSERLLLKCSPSTSRSVNTPITPPFYWKRDVTSSYRAHQEAILKGMNTCMHTLGTKAPWLMVKVVTNWGRPDTGVSMTQHRLNTKGMAVCLIWIRDAMELNRTMAFALRMQGFKDARLYTRVHCAGQ